MPTNQVPSEEYLFSGVWNPWRLEHMLSKEKKILLCQGYTLQMHMVPYQTNSMSLLSSDIIFPTKS